MHVTLDSRRGCDGEVIQVGVAPGCCFSATAFINGCAIHLGLFSSRERAIAVVLDAHGLDKG
jgi:hypothetical protein